ncbi:MAG: efflux transporter periplasmic adaptor subunit [Pseudorhodobacter sp.]|nr:efflux transporter periplasmic adaptor subunit [Pseudorhodobacter sp.]
MRFLTRSLIGMFLAAVTIGLLAAGAYLLLTALEARRNAEARVRPVQERVFSANVVTFQSQTITPVLTAFGEVQSRRRLVLRAPGAGEIIELAPNFEEGAFVTAGQVLLRLDPTEAERARDTQRAALSDAEFALAAATRSLAIAEDDLAVVQQQASLRAQALARQRSISDRGFGTATATETAELASISAEQSVLSKRASLSQAQSQFDQASNTLQRQKIALSEAERKLANTVLRAEFDGLLSGVSAVQGGLVSNNEMLGELIDPVALEVSFRVSTAQFARLVDSAGQLLPASADVVLEISGAPLVARARLSRVGAAVGEGQTGRLLFAQIEAGATGFRAGDFVELRVQEPPLEGVGILPAAAVDAAGVVLVLGADDRLEEFATEVLRRQGDEVIVRAAALDGREVVAARSPLLGAGLKVRPLRSGGAEAAVPPAAATTAQGGGQPPARNSAATGGRPAFATAGGEMVTLTPERRAKLIAYVESAGMPAEARARTMTQLQAEQVPLQVVERLEQRIGG